MSKEFLLETAQTRNKTALPRVLQNEWGVRLPSERFVLTGVPWSSKEKWPSEDSSEDKGADSGAMEGVETEEQGVEDGEDGTMDDLFGSGDADHDMDQED